MAKTALERKRAQLERKQRERASMECLTHRIIERPFFEFYENHPETSDVEISLEVAGISWTGFYDDSGPNPTANGMADVPLETYDPHPNSIGKAEVMFDCLLQAATSLGKIIHEYKTDGVVTEIQKIRSATHRTSDDQKNSMDEIVRLSKIKEQLDKKFRRTFPAIEVLEVDI